MTGFLTPVALIIAAAATTAAGLYALSDSVLTNVVPPFEGSGLTVSIASFGTATLLLIFCLVFKKRISHMAAKRIGIGAGVALALGILAFVLLQQMAREYVYRYPPASSPRDIQTRHIRGDLHDRGVQLVGQMSVAHAVYQLGGPDQVNGLGTLWTEESRRRVINRLELLYMLLAASLTWAISAAAVAVWRSSKGD